MKAPGPTSAQFQPRRVPPEPPHSQVQCEEPVISPGVALYANDIEFDGFTCTPPDEVRQYLLGSVESTFWVSTPEDVLADHKETDISVVKLNDTYKKDFNYIADALEKTYLS